MIAVLFRINFDLPEYLDLAAAYIDVAPETGVAWQQQDPGFGALSSRDL
jgi:hypothetical protein